MSESLAQSELMQESQELARRLVGAATERSVRFATAESCTGGLVSGAITGVAGSSVPFIGGVVSYDSRVKVSVLGVLEKTLIAHGAVSSECAQEMAEGAKRLLGADIAVSITGIAGPGGAVLGKPVGTVWFGLATPQGTRTLHRHFRGDRDTVRMQSVTQALSLLLEGVMESSLSHDAS